MTIRRLILLLTCMAAIAILSGCSSVNPNTITVALSTAPPAALPAGATASVAATITNDSRKEGVDWTATCIAVDCGSFSPAHTASGGATTYTAPADIPESSVVSIIATSTRNSAKSASATTTVQFSDTVLDGNYVFAAAGTDSTAFTTDLPYYVAGVLIADGAGAITGGELTYVNDTLTDVNEAITGGSYTIGTDGRGTISLITANTLIGESGTLTLGAVLASSSKALITQFDTSATSSGTMDKQTAVNDPAGGFAFVVNGNDTPGFGPFPFALGGVLNIDSPGVISGAGSVIDFDEGGGTGTVPGTSITGTVSAVADDPLGSVTVHLDVGFVTPLEFVGYIVDDTHIKLAESDAESSMSGQAIGQGADTGTFVDNTFFSGAFVYGISGQGSAFGPVAFAAAISADGTTAGVLTGETDENVGGVVVHDTFTGTYAVDTDGTGRTPATTTFDTSATAGPTLIFYLTGSGNPPLVLNQDSSTLGTGIVLPQSGPAADGAYALGFSAIDTSGNEIDGTAQITADGSAGTFTGTGDINVEDDSVPSFTPNPGETVSGTFTASAIDDGRFDSTLTIGSGTPFATALYVADPTQGFIIENDDTTGQVALGIFIAAQE